MLESLYSKSIVCPVCKKSFEITKVRSKECVVSSRDTDFCTYYEGINPIFYDVWVCEQCGYAAQGDRFESVSAVDARTVKENITPHWNSRSFSGERDMEKALEAFKLALYVLYKTNAKASEFAKVCIRIAWLYRIQKDSRELEFLRHALKYYGETYEREDFPVGKLDKYTCMYMIAELNRRVGNFDEAIVWFNKVVSSPEAKSNKLLMENAREQYRLAKEQKAKV